MTATTRDDPLNEVLLPAAHRAQLIVNGERTVRNGERLLAGALLVLLQERASLIFLLKEEMRLREAERRSEHLYITALKEAMTPAQLHEVNSYRQLLQEDLKKTTSSPPKTGRARKEAQAFLKAEADRAVEAAVRGAESIRSPLNEIPANPLVKAPSGLEPLFPSAEPKADR